MNERKPWKLERGKAVAAAKPVAVAEARQATPSLDLPSAWRRWTEEKGCVYMYLYISLSSECARLLQHAIVRVVVKKRKLCTCRILQEEWHDGDGRIHGPPAVFVRWNLYGGWQDASACTHTCLMYIS